MCFFIFFFFSSRRRHTRCSRDWSSDVCSSDLVRRIEVDKQGRVTGATYFDENKKEQFQRARAVVLCCNGSETPRLLLLSASSRFPNGLANSSGVVGKYLMFNGYSSSSGVFERPLNEYKSVTATRVLYDFYESDPKRGFYGGGAPDARSFAYPTIFALGGLPHDAPPWGAGDKRILRDYYTRTMNVDGHPTSPPPQANTNPPHPAPQDR